MPVLDPLLNYFFNHLNYLVRAYRSLLARFNRICVRIDTYIYITSLFSSPTHIPSSQYPYTPFFVDDIRNFIACPHKSWNSIESCYSRIWTANWPSPLVVITKVNFSFQPCPCNSGHPIPSAQYLTIGLTNIKAEYWRYIALVWPCLLKLKKAPAFKEARIWPMRSFLTPVGFYLEEPILPCIKEPAAANLWVMRWNIENN